MVSRIAWFVALTYFVSVPPATADPAAGVGGLIMTVMYSNI